jgi:hypothetical protein
VILAFDPSLTCTGWAVLHEDGPDGKLIAHGVIRVPDKGSVWERCRAVCADTAALVAEWKPSRVVVETPQTYSIGMGGKRSAATLPSYGMVVGALLATATLTAGAWTIRDVSASEWSRGVPGTKGDTHKKARVQYAASVYGLDPSSFGAVSVAGNVADAVLLARWAHHRREAAA